MSSFSGKIKEFPQISVDRFDGRNLASTAYFLSHAHSDHMIGLSSPQFLDHLESNSGVYLYCSQITARFLQASIRHRPLSPYIRPLQLEELVKITVPNVVEEATHQLWVTLIPAAHCPGSVMFLFEGRGGTVLYTGDFRISAGEVARLRPLHNADGTVKLIDSLLIDTTFCHGDIMNFPTREESAQAVGEAVEDWLARGNNFLIHLICPAKYGYEFIYRNLHERFGMKIHVSRWVYGMYDTVPEIQDVLTLDPTVTWIHACDYRVKNGEERVERTSNHQLPCRCVPFGVTSTPNIRVIKPSALFYAFYQSAKEIKQTNDDGSFCRVLLSMHASCSEVLDMVSYLRPRKVFPNVIPSNSTKEEVLKLLHEALNRSGDHYSIEYGGSQRTSLGSFKRQLNSSESSGTGTSSNSNSLLDASFLEVYLSSPNKRRRHSDSNMTLVLPTPRGNMKGSLSLEGETRHEDKADGCRPSTSSVVEGDFALSNSPLDAKEEMEWKDPYSSPQSRVHSYFQSSAETVVSETFQYVPGAKINVASAKDSNEFKKLLSNGSKELVSDMKHKGDLEESPSGRKGLLKVDGSQDSFDSGSVFSEEEDKVSVCDTLDNIASSRPSSSIGVAEESPIKQSRKMWYKHKYFSTPVHDEVDKGMKLDNKPSIGPRSSSLPLPESARDALLLPDFFTSADGEKTLPLITVSSPSDQASESQISDETNVTVILSSSGEPSDSDALLTDELPLDNPNAEGGSGNQQALNSHTIRPSVIRSPPKVDVDDIEKWVVYENEKSKEKTTKFETTSESSGWIDCKKIDQQRKKLYNVKEKRTTVVEVKDISKILKGHSSDISKSFVVKKNQCNLTSELVDLTSDSTYGSEFIVSSESRKSEVLGVTASASASASAFPSSSSSSRSSCLKTVRRTHDQVEVVSLDHHPL